MGYYTTYYFHCELIGSFEQKLDENFYDLLKVSSFGDDTTWDRRLDNRYAFMDGESVKWYDHDEDMLELSKKWPGVVFILDGDGEDTGDIWRSFYNNGKTYQWRPKIDRPKFSDEIARMLK